MNLLSVLLGSLMMIALIWIIVSVIVTAMMPWRYFDRDDRWLAWALIIGWPVIAAAMCVELLFEYLEARFARGG